MSVELHHTLAGELNLKAFEFFCNHLHYFLILYFYYLKNLNPYIYHEHSIILKIHLTFKNNIDSPNKDNIF